MGQNELGPNRPKHIKEWINPSWAQKITKWSGNAQLFLKLQAEAHVLAHKPQSRALAGYLNRIKQEDISKCHFLLNNIQRGTLVMNPKKGL